MCNDSDDKSEHTWMLNPILAYYKHCNFAPSSDPLRYLCAFSPEMIPSPLLIFTTTHKL